MLTVALVGTSALGGKSFAAHGQAPVIHATARPLATRISAPSSGQPGECSFFYLQDPQVSSEAGRVRVTSKGEARLGTDLGATCLSPLAWGGFVELFAQPRLDGWLLRFEIVDSNLLNEKKEKEFLTGQLWDRIKESVQPRFGAVTIDLGGPFRDLRDFLNSVVAPAHAEEAHRALASLRPVAVNASTKGVVVEAALEVADSESQPRPGDGTAAD